MIGQPLFCFATLLFSGCWQKTEECSSDGLCTANRRSTKAKYCCCYGNMCNVNISDVDSSQFTSENPLSHGKILQTVLLILKILPKVMN